MPPSVHSPSPDHARHVHEEPLQSGAGSLQPKVINKRPAKTSTTAAGASAPSTTGVESRRPSSLSRTPQAVTPPSSTEVVGPEAVRRRKVGSAQASSERPLVQRKKRSVPGNNVGAGRPSTESSETTTTTPSTKIQDSANNISGDAGAGANQISTMGMYGSPYGLGMSPYGGMGMYGMGMYGGGMMMGGAGPFSGLNNFLFGFQSVVFSLGQAMQILGMNTHALQQLFHTAMSFFDNAMSTLNEIRALNIASASDEEEMSEEEIKRRRRLKALRWSLVMGVSYAGYKLMRRWLLRRRQLRHMIATGVNPAGQSVDAGMGGGEPTHANRYSPYGPPAGGSSYGYGSSNNMLMNGSQYGYDGIGTAAGGAIYGSRYSPYSSSHGGAGNYGGGYGGYSGGVNDGAGYFPGY